MELLNTKVLNTKVLNTKVLKTKIGNCFHCGHLKTDHWVHPHNKKRNLKAQPSQRMFCTVISCLEKRRGCRKFQPVNSQKFIKRVMNYR